MLHDPFSASAKYSFSLHIVASNCCRSSCKQAKQQNFNQWIVEPIYQFKIYVYMLYLLGLQALAGIWFGIWRMCHRYNLFVRTLSCRSGAALAYLVVSFCWCFLFFFSVVQLNFCQIFILNNIVVAVVDVVSKIGMTSIKHKKHKSIIFGIPQLNATQSHTRTHTHLSRISIISACVCVYQSHLMTESE